MKSLAILFIVHFIFIVHKIKGQGELLENADFANVIQNILPEQEYDVEYDDLYDRLFTLYTSPINLNNADREDFQSLYFLNEEQISGIINYRELYGQFKTIYELLTINGFDRETVEKLSKFLRIKTDEKVKFYQSLKDPGIHELVLRYQSVLEQKKGYSSQDTLSSGRISSRYAGGPARLYGRYLFARPNQYSFGFTIEKDPGEKLIWDPSSKRYGMDYYSFHGMVENIWKISKIVIGDFTTDYGQGLVFGSGFRVGKGIEPVTTIRRNSMGLRPYRSVYEGKDYRGVAVSKQFNTVNLNLFISDLRRDAKIIADESSEAQPFTSYINDVGLHRTPYEIASKHAISNRAYGGNVNVRLMRSNLEIGFNGVYNEYSAELLPTPDKYRLFQFKGNSNYNASSYVNYYFKKGHMFNELAISKSGGTAHTLGLILSLSSHIQTALHYRNYDKKYHTFSSNAFGENTTNSNERGIYWGIRIKPIHKLFVTGYFDYFTFPWLQYRVDAPSKGRDFMGSINYSLDPKTTVIIQYRNKIKSENRISESEPVVNIFNKSTTRIRIVIDHRINNIFSVKTRIQSSQVEIDIKKIRGFMIAQDVSYTTPKLSLTGRFALFDADDYDSRLYMYERDLLYVYSVPSFSNRGIRYYMMGKYECSRLVTFWFKYAQSKYFDQNKSGAGLEEIDGNTKTNISFQIRFKF